MRSVLFSFISLALTAQMPQAQPQGTGPVPGGKPNESSFRKLEGLPTPNVYRAASGAPGHRYWQQKVDYRIKAELDDATQKIHGVEEITYHNNSPDDLRYLWLQLDQNLFRKDSVGALKRGAPDLAKMAGDDKQGLSTQMLRFGMTDSPYEGHKILAVKDAQGRELKFTVVDTMMRVDLPEAVKAGQVFKFTLGWEFTVTDYRKVWGRSGFETMEDGARLYNIAQWQPRLVAYTDDMGWQHQQFLGQGEFTLEFGDWDVEFTVPANQVVLATGELQNAAEVLTQAQRDRITQARKAGKPTFIVKPEEAGKPESRPKKDGKLTWKFKATNVRDFALACSNRLIWDAEGVDINGRNVLAMSGYTKEGMPLWDKYSTAAVAHTLKVYGRYTFDYPYPVAISALGLGGGGGMEYPMICFNGPRPEKDGTYSERTKLGTVGVIIHEVGHNFFPMIVNSDERQWSWMDEGLNTFLQGLAEREWDPNFPGSTNQSENITDYLRFPNATPIMTQSDAVRDFGFNAYQKPAAGLNLLRETIMGRELFDFSFKEYARRWKFKRPQPADLFRTLNDASGMDLDWFWRGWFFTTAAPDLELEKVETFQYTDGNPADAKARAKAAAHAADQNLTRMKEAERALPGEEKARGIQDMYSDGSWDRYAVSPADLKRWEATQADLKPEEKELVKAGKFLHRVTVKNVGKFPMPILLKLTFQDGSTEVVRLPVESWMSNEERFSKLLVRDKALAAVELDPFHEIPDIDHSNDAFPRKLPTVQPLKLFKAPEMRMPNPMQQRKLEAEAKAADPKEK
ncbi:MAG TPA: M1 family metallopeptidase [Holophagaceae bacterium]|nr:M1 family metallopeptidase [Holophagaceae bacterium]